MTSLEAFFGRTWDGRRATPVAAGCAASSHFQQNATQFRKATTMTLQTLQPNGHGIATVIEPIIRATGVQKTYRTGAVEVHALRGIDYSVARGEMVAIMGPSGCGKTTLLNCLSGLDNVDAGQIWLEGRDLARMSDRERTTYRALRMGFVFQVFNLLPVLNAVENVELPLLVAGTKPKIAREKAMKALAKVGLDQWATHRPAELSGGQRQRVTIARSLVNDPAIVWADEPTGSLDSATANEIMDLLRDLNRQAGLTFILVTHDQGVGNRCDRIVRMSDGQIIDEDRPDHVSEPVLVGVSFEGGVS
jgi:putative ABC transport system ATP-binding protein